ncbi:MAG: DUF3793 family protein [Candidatus Altiarchaeota archaeon]|nr:DUF3793 family protein [Candidatus Altiarchaeota archaeon]
MSGIRENDPKGNKVKWDAKKDQRIRYLARRIANHIAPTLAGEKPATLMNLSNSCNGLFDLWNEFNKDIFHAGNIGYCELRRGDTNVIVLFFCRHKIDELLGTEDIRQFLSLIGYNTLSLEDALRILKSRYNPPPFPHELGVFLGIPLKDVKAFMGLNSLPYIFTSMWGVYGDSELSLGVMGRYRRAGNGIRRLLSSGEDPIEMINGVVNRNHN